MNGSCKIAFVLASFFSGCSSETKISVEPLDSQPTKAITAQQLLDQATAHPEWDEAFLADYVSFPASGVKIRQPQAFSKADAFDGFGHFETQSSIVATSMAGPFTELASGFTEGQLASRGWTLLRKQDIDVDGLQGILVNFEQPVKDRVYLKWLVMFGNQQKTTMVTATFPKPSDNEFSSRMKAAVLSTRLDDDGRLGQAELMPFELVPSQMLKLTPVISGTLFFTQDGLIPPKSPQDPIFVAARSIGERDEKDGRKFSEWRIRQTAETKDLILQSTENITVDGLDGFESIATGKDSKSGVPLVVYQTILFNVDSYYLMQGLIGAESSEVYLPEFKAMARSFKLK